ncbi:MAG: hypothetical protein U9R15_20810 [Chloroflexota bacterium]|nr:hypothetical protein [Chloroflexota bacterium]
MRKQTAEKDALSPILVTTITDTYGYFIYLGLATLVLTRLI